MNEKVTVQVNAAKWTDVLEHSWNYIGYDECNYTHSPGGMELLKKLAHDGRSIVIVLHDLPLAMQYCHELTVLEKGELKAKGAPPTLLEKDIPQQVFKVRLLPGPDGCYAVTRL